MAGDNKTEKPTPKRQSKARQQGQVAKSADFNTSLVLGGIALVLTIYGGYFLQYLGRVMRELLHHQLRMTEPLTPLTFELLFRELVYHIVMLALPFLAGAMVIGVAANLLQVRFLFTTQPLHPSLNKLNPLTGFKKMFSQRSLVELGKGILKMAIVGGCGFAIVHGEQEHLLAMGQMSFSQSWQLVMDIVLRICSSIAVVLFLLGLADWWYQKHQLTKQLMMTRQEVRDEMKNSQGDPKIKSKVRSMGQSILRQVMMKAVPTADVIVTNPTHFAVALQYDPDEAPAPRVVAKGADHLAFQIRELAKQNGVPIVENKPLARSLYAAVEVNHMVPPELFVAVAEVLAYVFKRNKGRRKRSVHKTLHGGANG